MHETPSSADCANQSFVMAEDIKESQSKLESKLDIMIEENKKSDKANSKIAKWTLIVAVLTLGATLAGIIIQLI